MWSGNLRGKRGPSEIRNRKKVPLGKLPWKFQATSILGLDVCLHSRVTTREGGLACGVSRSKGYLSVGQGPTLGGSDFHEIFEREGMLFRLGSFLLIQSYDGPCSLPLLRVVSTSVVTAAFGVGIKHPKQTMATLSELCSSVCAIALNARAESLTGKGPRVRVGANAAWNKVLAMVGSGFGWWLGGDGPGQRGSCPGPTKKT